MLELMEYDFRKTGADLQIVRASNGVQALEQLDGALPSLIIADISMPEMDGMALLETVRKMHRTRNIPYIVITSDTDQKTRDKAMGLGANDFIIKPFKVNEYFPRIQQWLS
jgi:CheY-like chemotaxis protein